MGQNGTNFSWNSKRIEAAALVAVDALSDEDIADKVGVARSTLNRWKEHSEFKARVSQIITEAREKLEGKGVVEKQNRLAALNDRWGRMRRVIEQRAENLKDIPGGGNTGLLVRQVKGIGKGEDFQVVEEYAVDTGLLREMREHERQAAQELGEWTDKHELTGKDGEDLFKHITVEIVDARQSSN
jgi:predicted DNA-binding protein (UPF0251 family)